eukprot:TRINITY_DN63818_c0_g1_i1.p1 TRINITY_DN63818_c0_g1~~TRINITY_DN63818_c0_g1_i1.p1  ORF type:complete len:609 (+),score=113.64 TRINITY_DN63818_c0_g1_i1:66-1892(+)
MSTSFHEHLCSITAEYERLMAENESFRRRLGLEDDSACHSIPPPTAAFAVQSAQNLPGKNLRSPSNPGNTPEPQSRKVLEPALHPMMLPGTVQETCSTVSGCQGTPLDTHRNVNFQTLVEDLQGSRENLEMNSLVTMPDTPAATTHRKTLRQSLKIQAPRQHEEPSPMDDSEVPTRLVILMDILPAIVIMLNALVTALQQDIAPGSTAWDIVEIPFTAFFVAELCGKMYVLGVKTYLWAHDWYWSWFDCFCVFLALFEMFMTYILQGAEALPSGIMGILKMLKLARLGRVVRLLRFKIFSELKMMIHGVVTGLRVLIWAVVLLIALVFFLGMTFRVIFGEDKEKFPEFSTVPAAMFTAFRCFTEGCASYTGTPLQETMRMSTSLGGIFMLAYILMFLFVSIGVFNLIMAVFIDSVNDGSLKKKQHYLGSTAAKTEYVLTEIFQDKFIDDIHPKQEDKLSSADTAALRERLTQFAPKHKEGASYVDHTMQVKAYMSKLDMVISEDTFNKWLIHDERLLDALNDADIDLSAKFDLFDVLDADLSGELDFVELIEGLMRCRGPVSKNDVIAIRNKVGLLIKMVTQMLRHFGLDEEDTESGDKVLEELERMS